MTLKEINEKYSELCLREKEHAVGMHGKLGQAFMARINFEATHFSKLLEIANAAEEFEKASHDYPEQSSFSATDQRCFLHWQSKLRETINALGKK